MTILAKAVVIDPVLVQEAPHLENLLVHIGNVLSINEIVNCINIHSAPQDVRLR